MADSFDDLLSMEKQSGVAPDSISPATASPGQNDDISDFLASTPPTADQLAKDPSFDPVQLAKSSDQTPQIARDVFRLRQNGQGPQTSMLQKAGNFASGLGTGLLNVGKLPYYAGQTAVNAAQALGADSDEATLRSAIAAQMSENRLSGTWDTLTGPNSPLRSMASDAGPHNQATKDADIDAQFDLLVHHAKIQDALEAGQVQDTGPTAALIQGARGLGNIKASLESENPLVTPDANAPAPPSISSAFSTPASQIVPSPQDLAQQGTPWTPADAQESGNISQAADPSWLLPLRVPGSGLARQVAGKIVGGAGDMLAPVASYLENKASKFTIPGAGISTLAGGPLAGLAALKAGAGAWLGGKVVGAAARVAQDVGVEAATGEPGNLSTMLGRAAVTGKSDIAAAMQKRAGEMAVGAVAAPLAMAPLNLLLANGNWNQLGQLEGGAVGAGGMGGASGFTFRPEILANADASLQKLGQAPTDNPSMDAMNAKGLAILSPEDAARFNAVRGFVRGMPVDTGEGTKATADVYALTPEDFAAELQRRGVSGHAAELADQEGYYDPKTGEAMVNAGRGAPGYTSGHEGGRIAEQTLELMGQNGNPMHQAMMDTLQNGLVEGGQPTRLFRRYIQQYKQGATPDIQSIPETDPYWTRTFLAKTVSDIVNRNGIAEYAVPPALADRVVSNVGKMWGKMTGTAGQFSTHDPESVQAINQAGANMLRTLAGAKFRGSFGDLQPGSAPQASGAPITPTRAQQGSILDALAPRAQPSQEMLDAMQKGAGPQSITPAPQSAVSPAAQKGPSPDVVKAMAALGVKPGNPKYEALQQRLEQEAARQNTASEMKASMPQKTNSPEIPESSNTTESSEPVPFGELHTWQQPEPRTAAKVVSDAVSKIPANAEGLKPVTDRFGQTRVRGDIDPTNPIHQQILAVSGIDKNPQALANLAKLQASKGQIQYVGYRSAEDLGGEHNAEKRGTDYGASTAQDRLEGQGGETVQTGKAFIPLSTGITKEGRVLSTGYSPDKLISNVALISKAAVKAGLPAAFDPKDLQAAIENQAHGYKGDGSGPFISDVTTKPDPNYRPTPIPPERYQVINMAMHEPGATKLASRNAGARGKAAEAQQLARANAAPVTESGDPNPLRDALKKAGFDAEKQLESPFESLYPELMTGVSDQPTGKHVVRPMWKGNMEPTFAAGIPDSTMARAGFKSADNSLANEGENEQNNANGNASGTAPIHANLAPGPGVSSNDLRRGQAAYEERTGKKATAGNSEAFRAAVAPIRNQFPSSLLSQVEARGGEHSVVFQNGGRVLKITEPDSAGGVVKFGSEGEPKVFHGTAPEYAAQIEQNRNLIGDDQRIEGVMNDGDSKRIVSSQTAVDGVEPSAKEVESSMRSQGFIPVDTEMAAGQSGVDTFWNPRSNVAITDAKTENFVKTPSGKLVPIDVKAWTPSGQNLRYLKDNTSLRDRAGFQSASAPKGMARALEKAQSTRAMHAAMAQRRRR